MQLDTETAQLALQLLERLDALASKDMGQFHPNGAVPTFDGIYRELMKQRFNLVRATPNPVVRTA